MAKSLVIVESPAKVKTISKFLGKSFIVKSSVGHIRDLASNKASAADQKTKKNSKAKESSSFAKYVDKMGVDPYNDWRAVFEILPGKEKVLKGLQDAAEKSDTIYLATDLDREGEAIAWHLMEAIGGSKDRYKRVTFTEITKDAIQDAFSKPTELNMDRVQAQQARRYLDRVVGFLLSPLLWQKVARGLSAGRVQSVAVKLISGREREIHAFKPEEYWEVSAGLSQEGKDFKAQVSKFENKAFRPTSGAQIKEHLARLNSSDYIIDAIERKHSLSKASAPFITSTLQQAASTRFSYGVKKTMMLAQHLYEAGFITYMRTDSTSLSKEAVEQCRGHIEQHFGQKYLPKEPNNYSSKKTAQEAHEAIRPTDIGRSADEVIKATSADAQKLYQLIWNQFVACQMVPAEFDNTNVIVKASDYQLKAKGRILKFDGFLRVMGHFKKNDDVLLPDLKEGEGLNLKELFDSQHFTKPPPRFSEASLVKELEKQGIGRPSTYASIISTIQDRGYVALNKRRFFCLKMGEIVTDRLTENFHDLMNYSFTAHLEEDLDKIASGQADWQSVLNAFFAQFSDKLENAASNMRGNDPTLIDLNCPECDRKMNVRTARTGVFLSCSGYALPPKERCKSTINLTPGEEVEEYQESDDGEVEGNVAEIQAKRRCEKCDTAMDSYLVNETTKLHICGNNPDCDSSFIEAGKFRIKGYEGPIIQCDKCNDEMQLKSGRFGKYFACNKAPDCKNTRKLLKNGEAAPPKADPIHMEELPCEKSDGYFVLRDGAAGIFLASSKFPKSRETKKPRVSDLVRHKEKLDPKYAYILEAPEQDPDGNDAIVRFSRKTKLHFIMSEVDGKATGWSLLHVDGKWVEKS